MDPNAFVAEVYRRMAIRHAAHQHCPDWRETEADPKVVATSRQYTPFLPPDKTAGILDIGFGSGWFLAACLKLGYRNLYGADFGISHKDYVRAWAPDRITLFEIEDNIGDFLRDKNQRFDFIHLSHVIEHIPKYSLFWVVDALYWALKPGGVLMLRTPNMEGPCANSSLYVTLSHEYGFAGANLVSLLDICGFDDIRFVHLEDGNSSLKQRLGSLLRWPIMKQRLITHRLFGVNFGGQFGMELAVTGKRGDRPPFFDARYR